MATAADLTLDSPRDQTRLFGHGAAQSAFINAWHAGRVPHAWLIHGQAGIGKATFAYHLARWVMTPERPTDTLQLPEGHALYRQFSAGAVPGLLVIEPVEREKTGGQFIISVTQVRGGFDDRTDVKREFKGIYEFLRHTSAGDGWRIVIIDQADMLNEAAQNAVLKILEEPPARALIVLTTSQPGRLLPTIRSRCRQLALGPLPEAELESAAKSVGFNLPKDAAPWLRAARGSLGELARVLTLDVAGMDDIIGRLLRDLPQLDWQAVHQFAVQIARKDAEPQFDLAMELLADRMRALTTRQPAIARDWPALALKIRAIKDAHLDTGAGLIDIFSQIQKMVAVAGRAA